MVAGRPEFLLDRVERQTRALIAPGIGIVDDVAAIERRRGLARRRNAVVVEPQVHHVGHRAVPLVAIVGQHPIADTVEDDDGHRMGWIARPGVVEHGPGHDPDGGVHVPAGAPHTVSHHATVAVPGRVDLIGSHVVVPSNVCDELLGEVDVVVVNVLASPVARLPIRRLFGRTVGPLGIRHEKTMLIGQRIESEALPEVLLPVRGAIPKAVVDDDQRVRRRRVISGGHVQDVLPHEGLSAHLLGDGPIAGMGTVEGAHRIRRGLGKAEER